MKRLSIFHEIFFDIFSVTGQGGPSGVCVRRLVAKADEWDEGAVHAGNDTLLSNWTIMFFSESKCGAGVDADSEPCVSPPCQAGHSERRKPIFTILPSSTK